MQFLILSDLHANWYALEAVLEDAKNEYQEIICCGDLVGYNPHPGRIVDWTEANCSAVVRGNHDKVVAGTNGLEWFNDVAQISARWTIADLQPKQLEYLRSLEKGPLTLEHFQIWHGSPRDEDEYVTTAREAGPCFESFGMPLAFFGHTHLQGGFFLRHSRIGMLAPVRRGECQYVLELEPDTVFMINPGSVGQPRDADPRAAYALLDTEQRTVTLRRVEYSVSKTADEIREAGLPDVLGQRLFFGM